MEKYFVVVSQSEARQFDGKSDGQSTTIKAVDVLLSDGINQIIASAYDKKAQQLIDKPLKPGAFINADLTFSTKEVKTEKSAWLSQQVRLNNYAVISES
ncbi:MAG: hypothetical protein J6S87_03565 [Bacteroidales bacterium]|nr:hypothetical protein [Bacteroidales bacterium]MBP5630525.1 hypothetical protein [Bacteroidaceae bacterium]